MKVDYNNIFNHVRLVMGKEVNGEREFLICPTNLQIRIAVIYVENTDNDLEMSKKAQNLFCDWKRIESNKDIIVNYFKRSEGVK